MRMIIDLRLSSKNNLGKDLNILIKADKNADYQNISTLLNILTEAKTYNIGICKKNALDSSIQILPIYLPRNTTQRMKVLTSNILYLTIFKKK